MEKKLNRRRPHRSGTARLMGAVAAVAVAVPAMSAVVSLPAQADQSAAATPGVIAFVESDPTTNTDDLWLMHDDGTDRTRLTFGASGNISHPAISPDGSKIAFDGTSSRGGSTNIFVIDPDGTELTQLTADGGAGKPAWSPDGTKIAYDYQKNTAGDMSTVGIYVMNADGTGAHQVTSDSDGMYGRPDKSDDIDPTWSPDGTRIGFTRITGNAGLPFIDTVNPDGTSLTIQVAEDAYDPAWSTDGTKFAYAYFSYPNDEDIYTVNTDGTGLAQITTTGSNSDPAWSPDGTQIAFTGKRDGNDEIFVMNADGSNQTNLTDGAAVDVQPSWGRLYIAPVKPKTFTTVVDHVFLPNTAQVGVPIRASLSGAWTIGTTTLTSSYQWGIYNSSRSIWTPIPGATSDSYTPTPKQEEKELTVQVSTTAPDGYVQPDPVRADPPLQVEPGTLATATPVIHGTAKVGKTLTVSTGAWRAGTTPLTSSQFQYAWYANKTLLTRKPTLKLAKAQRGRTITVQVTGVAKGYFYHTRTSKAVGPVKR